MESEKLKKEIYSSDIDDTIDHIRHLLKYANFKDQTINNLTKFDGFSDIFRLKEILNDLDFYISCSEKSDYKPSKELEILQELIYPTDLMDIKKEHLSSIKKDIEYICQDIKHDPIKNNNIYLKKSARLNKKLASLNYYERFANNNRINLLQLNSDLEARYSDLEARYLDTRKKEDKLRSVNDFLQNQNKEQEKYIQVLEENKKQETQIKIDAQIPVYVSTVNKQLQDDAKEFSEKSNWFYVSAIITGLIAFSSPFIYLWDGLEIIRSNQFSWAELVYIYGRGLLTSGILLWVTYILFSNARKYTHESIRRKDRLHAVQFGRLFIQIYGDRASKEDVLNAFKDWNISEQSAFSAQDKSPPNAVKLLEKVLKMLQKKESKEIEN